jgi:hypothetical protein
MEFATERPIFNALQKLVIDSEASYLLFGNTSTFQAL